MIETINLPIQTKEESKTKKKYMGINILRIAATIFVFVIHFRMNVWPWKSYSDFAGLNGSYIQQFLVFFVYGIVEVAVPIFLIISGFCNYKNEEITFKSYVTKIIKNYLPYIIACTMYLCTYIFIGEIRNINGVLSWAKQTINFSLSYMWYMGSYFILLLLMPYINLMVKKLSKKEHLMLIGILILAVSVPTTINLYVKGLLNIYYVQGLNIILYYIIGTFFKRNLELINKKNVLKVIVVTTAIIVISFILLPKSGMDVYDINGILALAISTTTFMTIFYYGNKIKENRFIIKLSGLTFFMYMIGWNYERITYHLFGTKVFANNIIYCIIFIVGEVLVTALISLVLKKLLDKVEKSIFKLIKI